MQRLSTICKRKVQNSIKQIRWLDFDVRGQQQMDIILERSNGLKLKCLNDEFVS